MLTKFVIEHFNFKDVCHYFVVLFFCFVFFTQPVLNISYNYANSVSAKNIIEFLFFSVSAIFTFRTCLTLWSVCCFKECLKSVTSNEILNFFAIFQIVSFSFTIFVYSHMHCIL